MHFCMPEAAACGGSTHRGAMRMSVEPSEVCRRVCRLPAFAEEFTAATPLTRIRDIAHRGDIPHELKQEIKHTIQVRVPALVLSLWLLFMAYPEACMQLVSAEHRLL